MYDPKKIVDISNTLIKGFSEKHNKFLDERRTEWSRIVDKNFRRIPLGDDQDNVLAVKRLNIFREIVSLSEKYCRRDIEIPDLEYQEQLEKIELFNRIRADDGLTEPFPGILEEKAKMCILRSEYLSALDSLGQAIDVNKNYTELIVRRDDIRYLCLQVYCHNMLGQDSQALEKANLARKCARKIDALKEEVEWRASAAAPGLNFTPVEIHAYFSACEARIHHSKWEEDEKLRNEFSGLWNDSATNYNTPKTWTIPMKIAAISDKMWVSRAEDYVQSIAESLYIDTAENIPYKITRIVRSKWGGFNVELPKTAAAAVALIAFLAVSDVDKEYPIEQIREYSISYVMKNSKDFTKDEVSEIVNKYIPGQEKTSVARLVENEIKLVNNSKESTLNLMQLAMSGGEGSVLRI